MTQRMRGDAIIFHACIPNCSIEDSIAPCTHVQWAAVLTSEHVIALRKTRHVLSQRIPKEYGHGNCSRRPVLRQSQCGVAVFVICPCSADPCAAMGEVKIPNRQCHRLANTDADICEETDEQRVCVRRVVRPCLDSLNHFGVFAVTSRLCGELFDFGNGQDTISSYLTLLGVITLSITFSAR